MSEDPGELFLEGKGYFRSPNEIFLPKNNDSDLQTKIYQETGCFMPATDISYSGNLHRRSEYGYFIQTHHIMI